MAQFVLLMYQPADGGPAPEAMADEHKKWMAFSQDLKDAGLYRADNHGLRGVEAATTVRVRDGGPRSPTARSPRPRRCSPATG